MLFNSYEFIFLFLPITLIIYFLLNRFNQNKLSKAWLVIASLYFYSYFNKKYLILILLSIAVNYYLGTNLTKIAEKTIKKKVLLIIGVVFNLGALGYFKYYDFFIENINYVFHTNFNLLHIILPLGISFFTFQQLSYVIDCYTGVSLKYDFLSYSLFVTFFPQLIAGPIVLPSEMLPQFEDKKNRQINWENMNKGLYIFSIGLAKKVLIADTISAFVITGFDIVKDINFIEAWISSISYTLQLYFDFSGYCDMAMGIALMFNIILPINFDSPYKSTNIQEFWRKWHITLGRFMTNYLYIPLGGNRKGEIRTLRNLLVVFLASGIWHGAGWNFIIWGLLHGVCILIHRVWKNSGKRLPKLVGWFITINLVNIFWVFFRAVNLKDAFKMLRGMFDFSTLFCFMRNPIKIRELTSTYRVQLDRISVTRIEYLIIILVFSICMVLVSKNSMKKVLNYNTSVKYNVEIVVYVIFSVLYLNRVSEFLYFNF